MTWNSGNFCSVAASNSKENLNLYLSQMAAPAIPYEYVYETCLFRDLIASLPNREDDEVQPHDPTAMRRRVPWQKLRCIGRNVDAGRTVLRKICFADLRALMPFRHRSTRPRSAPGLL